PPRAILSPAPFPCPPLFRSESFCLLEVADGEDGIEVGHRLLVSRQHHGDIRRIPGLYRRLDLRRGVGIGAGERGFHDDVRVSGVDRKSTRLNSSHVKTSYAA